MYPSFLTWKDYEEKQVFKFELVWLVWHPETVIVSPGRTEEKVYGANTLLELFQQRKQVENAGGMIQGIRDVATKEWL